MNKEKKDLLVTMADANFVNQAKQLFSSVYFNAGWKGDYLLLTCGISKSDSTWFRDKGILVYDQPLLSDLPLGVKNYHPIMLSKFYLFREYFKKWRKVIYLDADIIVRGSLDKLLETNGFSAPNASTFRLRNEFISDKLRNYEIRKKYNLSRRAFCAGILVFDSSLICEDTFNELLDLYNKFKDLYQFSEESTLNLYFYKKWKMLPLVYNFAPWSLGKFYGIKPDDSLAVIIHFVCVKVKPWEKNSVYHREWFDNLKKAEEIDLSYRPGAAKELGNIQIYKYLFYLRLRGLVYPVIKRCNYINQAIYQFINCQIGLLGIYIKKKNLKLYERLIKFKKLLF